MLALSFRYHAQEGRKPLALKDCTSMSKSAGGQRAGSGWVGGARGQSALRCGRLAGQLCAGRARRVDTPARSAPRHGYARADARPTRRPQRNPSCESRFSALLGMEPRSDRIQRSLRFVRDHLHETLPVERLTNEACHGPRQFGRAFLAKTGLPGEGGGPSKGRCGQGSRRSLAVRLT
jgi:hypothetical protein